VTRRDHDSTSTRRTSRFSRRHLIAGGAAIGVPLMVIAAILYREWVYGPPHFSYPIGATPDEALPAVREPLGGVDLATTTPDDFPEFLGSGRRAAVENVRLDPDWDATPPKLLWRQPIGAGWSAFSAVNGFAVTMEQRGEREQVTCYAVVSGKHHWTADWDERFTVHSVGPRSTPTIRDGRVYALGAWGHLTCLDGSTGGVIWQRELLHDLGLHWSSENKSVGFGRSNSPLVTETLVIVPGGGPPNNHVSLLAYDAATGEPRWRGGKRQISYSSPVLAKLLGRPQVLTVNEDTVSGHSPDTGEQLWSYPWPGNSSVDANVSQPVPLSESRILLSAGYRRGAAVIELSRPDPSEPIRVRRVWRRRSVLNTKFTNVVVWQGCAYGLSNGALEAVDLETGELHWKAPGYGDGQLLRVGDLLLVLRGVGELVLVQLDVNKPNTVLGRLKVLTGTTWNNLALYGNRLLIRNATEAACYELARAEEVAIGEYRTRHRQGSPQPSTTGHSPSEKAGLLRD
jgi:outer membrane protein assembly factor BamB